MSKLHKLPVLKFRRVENDSKKPLIPLAKWVLGVLELVVSKQCVIVVQDSKTVLAQMQHLKLHAKEGHQVFMIASDIVDLYPQIDLDSGIAHVYCLVAITFGPQEASFVMLAIRIFFEHK